MRRIVAACGLVLALAVGTWIMPESEAQAPTLVGRWQIEFTLSDSRPHAIQFDATDSGAGTLLLLDPRSDLIEPARPEPATWQTQAPNQATISGNIEFPIGNVGMERGRLVFTGTLESAATLRGTVEFFSPSDGKDGGQPPTKSGPFVAQRQDAPAVRLTAPTAKKLVRGKEVTIQWSVQSSKPILSQQLFLSVDGGENYVPITPAMGDDTRSYVWMVPASLPKTRRAMIKILVTDSSGNTSFDLNDKPIKLK